VSVFSDLMVACHAALYRYARALSHDPDRAAELVQETYKRALAARTRPPAREDEVRAWLFTILRHIWQNDLRDRSHEVQSDDNIHAPEPVTEETPESAMMRRLLQSEVRQSIDVLPAALREVIVLREIENLSYAEIARILQCPVGTVMSRLARARGALRRLFAKLAQPSREVRR
jgi:RNA polymerase sigma-70 factor (ECF subfamily)